MPISQGIGAGGMPGMQLKAWALMDAGTSIIRSYNIDSVGVATPGGSVANRLLVWKFKIPMKTRVEIVKFTASLAIGASSDGGGAVQGRLVRRIDASNCETRAVMQGSGMNNTGIPFLIDGQNFGGGLWEFYE